MSALAASPPAPAPIDARRAHLGVGVLIFAGLGLQLGVWIVLVADVASALGLSPGRLGQALVASTAAGIVAMVLGGALVDRLGRRPIGVAGFAVSAVALALFAGVHRMGALVGALVLFGLAGSFVDLAGNTIGADVERRYRIQVMNWLHAGYSGGVAAGAGLTALAFERGWHYPAIFLTTSAIAGCLAVVLCRAPLPEPPARPAHPAGAGHHDGPGHHDSPGHDGPGHPARSAGPGEAASSWRALAVPAVVMPTVMLVCAYSIDGALNSFQSLYLRSVFASGRSAASAGVLLVALAGLVGRLIAGGLVRRVGSRRAVRSAALVATVGIGVAVATRNAGLAVAGLLAVALGLAPVVPTALSAVARAVPARTGRAVGVAGATGYVALILSPVLVGALADRTDLRFAIGALMLAGAGIAAMTWWLPSGSRAAAGDRREDRAAEGRGTQ